MTDRDKDGGFGLMQMVDDALPASAPEEIVPAIQPKAVPRRVFLEKSGEGSVGVQLLPSLLKVLMTNGDASMPEGAEDVLSTLPTDHPLKLIGHLAQVRGRLGGAHCRAREEAFGKHFRAIEDESGRTNFAQSKSSEMRQTYRDYTKAERQLFTHRAAVEAFVDQHYDQIAAMGEFKHDSPRDWLRFIMPQSEEKIGELERDKLTDGCCYFAADFEHYAACLKQAREVLKFANPKVNPFDATEGMIRGTQKLMDLYSQHRKETYDHLRDFKRFVWVQKNLYPSDNMPNVEEEMESRIENSSRAYDKAIDMAQQILKRQDSYKIFKMVGKVDFDWKRYGFTLPISRELDDLGGSYKEGAGEKVIEKLCEEKAQLKARYEAAAEETLVQWKMLETLKDPLTSIDHSHSLFKIIRLDSGELEHDNPAAKQQSLDQLESMVKTLYPDAETKTAKGMLFIDRCDPRYRRPIYRPTDELFDALETMMKRKNIAMHQHQK